LGAGHVVQRDLLAQQGDPVTFLGVAELFVGGGGVAACGGECPLGGVGVPLGAGGFPVGFDKIQFALVQLAL
jgi:hypothetical protein